MTDNADTNGKQQTITITRDQLKMERLIAMRAEPNTRIATHDRGGNKLRDVIDPSTGFCTGVTSPLLFSDTAGKVVTPDPCVKGSGSAGPRKMGNGLYVTGVGASRRVVRTTDMGDEPIPTYTSTKTDRRAAAASKVKRAPKDTSKGRPKGTGNSGTGPSRQEIAAWVAEFCGYTGPLKPGMVKAARVAMAHAAQIAAYTAK